MRLLARAAAAFALVLMAGCAAHTPPIGNATDARALSEHGLELFEQGDYPGAMDALNAVIAHGSVDDRDFTRRAAVEGAMKDYDKALADTDRAIALDPHEWRTYLQRALFHQRLGQFDAAIADLDTAIANDPRPVELFRRRAYLKIVAGHYASAIADYDALMAGGDSTDAGRLGHGVVLYLEGNWRGATNVFESILGDDPSDGLTALWLAKASLRAGLPEDWQNMKPAGASDTGWVMTEALLTADRVEDAAARVAQLEKRGVSPCEQSLFMGAWRLLRAAGDGAGAAFEKARTQCPTDSIEGAEARAELARLKG